MNRFDEVMETVFKWEGGFFNHPDDNEGATNMGITHRVLASWRGVSAVTINDVRNLTREEATDIFEDRYWKRIKGPKLPKPLDLVVMDGAVNHGVPRMSRFLQEAIGVKIDGRLTNSDIERLEEIANSKESVLSLVIQMAERRKDRYVNHEDAGVFLKGWTNRLNDVMSIALKGTDKTWTLAGGLSDGEPGGTVEPEPVTTNARSHIDDEDLQAAMAVVGIYTDEIDGIFGQRSVVAMNEVFQRNGGKIAGSWRTWSIARRKIALGQLVCHDLGIDAGAVDGLFGPQTAHAFEGFNRKRLNLPGDDWRGDIDELAGNKNLLGNVHDNSWPHDSTAALTAFYGPHGVKGGFTPPMKRLSLPYEVRIAWDQSKTVDGFYIHGKVHDSAARVFDKIYSHYGDDGVEEIGVNIFSGCYSPRRIRGGTRWSTHSWAIAIDFDDARNQLKWSHKQARLARGDAEKFWEFWEEEGWVSLGRTRDYDWMHVQAAHL